MLELYPADRVQALKARNVPVKTGTGDVESGNTVRKDDLREAGGPETGWRQFQPPSSPRYVVMSDAHRVSSKSPQAPAAASWCLLSPRTERQGYLSLATTPTWENLGVKQSVHPDGPHKFYKCE